MFGYGDRDRGGPGRWLGYLFEAAVIIAASGYLIRLGVQLFLEVWWVLLIIAAVIAGAAIGWHIWKNRRNDRW
ncbi:MAG: hypothetical protein NC305_11010 [Lachnospiraceae bacterium]|nr:hypothetical protein [Muribaculaceae bacterium]MCM1411062.1 hypothetical protein [Lachnospiraceae bacterium]